MGVMTILVSVQRYLSVITAPCGNQYVDFLYEALYQFVHGAVFNAGGYL